MTSKSVKVIVGGIKYPKILVSMVLIWNPDML